MVAKQSRPGWRFKQAAWPSRLAAAAVALVLILLAAALWSRRAAREQEIAELLDLHTAALASPNPVDVVSTDRHTVKPWFQGKIPFTFNLPELAGTPYQLTGGKLIYFEGYPAAQLLFRLGKHEISVFVMPDRTKLPASGVLDSKRNGFSVETWPRAGLRYTVAGDASQSDIHALGELLRSAAGQ